MEKPSHVPVKAREFNLHSKKRKSNEVIELDDSPLNFDQVLEQLKRCHMEDVSAMESLKRALAAKEEIVEKEAMEIAIVKKQLRDLEAQHNEAISMLKTEHAKELDDLSSGVRKDAAVAILESRLNMATEAAAKGFDTSIWASRAQRGGGRD